MRIGIIAKESHKVIGNYFRSSSDFNCDFSIDSVIKSGKELTSSIFNTDRMLYIDETIDVSELRNDMLALEGILKEDTYFKVSSIIYIIKRDFEERSKFIEAMMEKLDNENYTIIEDTDPDISSILKYIKGVKTVDEKARSNVFDKVYRVRRNTVEVSDGVLENFNLPRHQRIAELKEYREGIYDTLPSVELKDSREINFRTLPAIAELLEIESTQEIYLITGLPSSGKTVLTLALASSARSLNKRVAVVDLQNNSSTTINVERLKMESEIYSVKATKFEADLSIVSCIGIDINDNVKQLLVRDRMKYLKDFDIVIIDYPVECNRFTEEFRRIATKHLFTTSNKRNNLIEASKRVDKNDIIVLMNVYSDFIDGDFLSAEEAREIIKDNTLTSLVTLKGLNVSENLYRKVSVIREKESSIS